MQNSFIKYIRIVITGILVSCFFFPFEFVALPGLNTKKVMAAIGLVVFGINSARNRGFTIDRKFFAVVLGALVVSLIGFASCVYNNTTDYVYANYITSFAVWIFAAYLCVASIQLTHDNVSFITIGNYLIAICVVQCILALMIDMIPYFKGIVDRYIVNVFDVAEKHRMYGIGASLDVAGSRFAAVLIIITAILSKEKNRSNLELIAYFTAFAIITIVGNMIGRTTTVGLAFSIIYIVIVRLRKGFSVNIKKSQTSAVGFVTLSVYVLAAIILYNTNEQIHENIRFGFEGFFSLIETGRWQTTSNDSLMTMWIWPESLKTWIIGDGYFGGAALDPNYLGSSNMTNYYMGTDIGYCRFIFYFGVIGLASFALYFWLCMVACNNRFEEWKQLFIFILALNFTVWIKVSSDIFPVFAIFLCSISQSQESSMPTITEDNTDSSYETPLSH